MFLKFRLEVDLRLELSGGMLCVQEIPGGFRALWNSQVVFAL